MHMTLLGYGMSGVGFQLVVLIRFLEKDRLLFDVTDRQNMKGHLSKFANRYIEYIGKIS